MTNPTNLISTTGIKPGSCVAWRTMFGQIFTGYVDADGNIRRNLITDSFPGGIVTPESFYLVDSFGKPK